MHCELSTTGRLRLDTAYRCPACRFGRIALMPLMEVMACDLCRHMFDVDLAKQEVKMNGSLPPLSWRWNGRTWHDPFSQGPNRLDKLVALAMLVFPAALVGGLAWRFGPPPDAPLAWLPPLWTALTFTCHLSCVLLAVCSYYQFSPLAFGKALMRRLRQRLATGSS
ncbi:MAG: hypothetical protein KME03_04255 [Aphanocapsa lilacina HA4352-LM1]|jgi:rubredoxin|nr:hypothetical protein [Aphanocapsa lilacina HA4352-LM1]